MIQPHAHGAISFRALGALLLLVTGVIVQQSQERAAGEGAHRCQLLRVTIVGTRGNDLLRGTPRHDVIAGLAGDDRVIGLGGSDTLCGGSGRDVLRGGEGIDFLAPGAGRDWVKGGSDPINVLSYLKSPSPVRVDLQEQTARGWGADVVSNVHQVEGSRFADVIRGSSAGNALIGVGGGDRLFGRGGDDSLIGGDGNDELIGGRGPDYVIFIDSPSPVEVDLVAGTASGEGDDDIKGAEHVFGSPGNDVLVGNAKANEFVGGVSGNDRVVGRRGNDTIFRYFGIGNLDGGTGRDRVFYALPGTIDLTSGTAAGLDFSDTLSAIESVTGGGGQHTIIGDEHSNGLDGGGGRDLLEGRGGDDQLKGGRGDDALAGGDGMDDLDGGAGDDACIEGESLRACEHSAAEGSVARSSLQRNGAKLPRGEGCSMLRRFSPSLACRFSVHFADGVR